MCYEPEHHKPKASFTGYMILVATILVLILGYIAKRKELDYVAERVADRVVMNQPPLTGCVVLATTTTTEILECKKGNQ